MISIDSSDRQPIGSAPLSGDWRTPDSAMSNSFAARAESGDFASETGERASTGTRRLVRSLYSVCFRESVRTETEVA